MSVRVLIADSDRYLLETYRDYLEGRGFVVALASNGVECVERLRDFAPDVLVMEPSMPWGSGDGVMAVMHEEADVPCVPVILLTNGRDRTVLYRLAPFKIADYQVKPLRASCLMDRINAVVGCCETGIGSRGRGGGTEAHAMPVDRY